MDATGRERAFTERRALLYGVAYRMLGRAVEAEDVVQDTWLRWTSPAADREVADPEAYLVRIATRLAIDRLRSAQATKEAYVGPWLPEPVMTDVADDVVLADSVSTAMLLILETLSPLERAVFVLHDVFGVGHGEIAETIGRSQASVRQTAKRAREHVADRRRRYDTDLETRRDVTRRFLAAAVGGDLVELLKVLAPEVELVCDGGGLAPAPRKIINGGALVAHALVAFAGRMPPEPTVEALELNGSPGVLIRSAGVPNVALILYVADGLLAEIHLISNPEKLTALV